MTKLGQRHELSEGRSAREWLAHLYERTRQALGDKGLEAPGFEAFWQRGELVLPQQGDDGGLLRAIRDDMLALPTPDWRE